METTGRNSVALRTDVGDISRVRSMAGTIREKFGRIDVIINNAGITMDNLMIRQTEQEWDSIIRTNLKGCFNVISALSPLMIQSGGGHIINISSRSGVKGRQDRPPTAPRRRRYSASPCRQRGNYQSIIYGSMRSCPAI